MRFRVFRNTHLMGPRALFTKVVRDRAYDKILASDTDPTRLETPSTWERLKRRLRPWFWPTILDAREWVHASEETGWGPSNYIVSEPRRLLQRVIDTTPPTASVLDLGCNSGAHLDILRQRGFARLYGVDAGREALDLFAEAYAETFAMADVRHDLFQRYLLSQADQFVDVVHSNGATLELVHPSFPIVAEICRVTRESIYIDIMERGHRYPRKYLEQFERHGFQLVYCERPLDLVEGLSLLQFSRV
jgi:SAM-dependent methyltransferase